MAQAPIELDAGFYPAEEIRQIEPLVRRMNRIVGQAEPQERDVDTVRLSQRADEGDGTPRRQQDGPTAKNCLAGRMDRPP